jgi:glycine oxidase
VIGGGLIGLSVARELAGDGWSVTVLERREPGQEASSAAAGMLVPALEFHSDPDLLRLGVAARDLYPSYVRDLCAETAVEVDLRLDGVLAPVMPAAERAAPPPGARVLLGDELRAFEPALAADIREACYFAGDGSIDNRALVRAVLAACEKRGVSIARGAVVEEVVLEGGRVRGVRHGGVEVPADIALNCAGAWAGQIRAAGAEVRVRPVAGQMLLLDAGRSRTGPRLTVYSPGTYLVPRSDGRVIVGTTVEDRGFEKRVEAGAIQRLLANAISICPSLSSARLAETWSGLRPRGERELPTVGPLGPPGLFAAVGHYRNGILLAPLTARVLADLVAGRSSEHAPLFGIDAGAGAEPAAERTLPRLRTG